MSQRWRIIGLLGVLAAVLSGCHCAHCPSRVRVERPWRERSISGPEIEEPTPPHPLHPLPTEPVFGSRAEGDAPGSMLSRVPASSTVPSTQSVSREPAPAPVSSAPQLQFVR